MGEVQSQLMQEQTVPRGMALPRGSVSMGTVTPFRQSFTSSDLERDLALQSQTAIATSEPRASVVITGVDRNRDGIPDILQQQPAPYGIPQMMLRPMGS